MNKIGLFGIGLDTYWGQFDGLLDRLSDYQKYIGKQIEQSGATVVDAGMVDSPEKAKSAGELLKSNDVEIVFLYVSTYALSSTVLPVAQKVNVPIIILNLQPVAAIDYAKFNAMADRGKMTGEWLAHCQACSVPEIANVFNRCDIRYEIVTGHLHDNSAWEEINHWIEAARVAWTIRNNRLGVLGHYYGGMLDVYTDLTQQSAVFGTHIELLEMCELKKYHDEVNDDELQQKLGEFYNVFDVSQSCEQEEMLRAARTSTALDKLVENHKLGSLAYYYEGTDGNDYENIVTSIIAVIVSGLMLLVA